AGVNVQADPLRDQLERRFYDADGLLVGMLDAAGQLVQWIYDAAGALLEQRSYAQNPSVALSAGGTLAQLTAGLKNSADRRELHTYDGTGAQIGFKTVRGYPEDIIPGVFEIKGA